MGQLVEIVAVEPAEIGDDGPLLGANVDSPGAGRKLAARAVEIGGWALGRRGPPEAIDVALEGTPLAQAPVRRPREDIGAAFPAVPGARSAGFDLTLDASRSPAAAELEVRARLGEGVVPVARLRLRRCWRGEWSPGEAPLVSVVVIYHGDPSALAATMRSIARQRYPCTEVLIAHPAPLADSLAEPWGRHGVRCVAASGDSGAALRNEGIRRSGGRLLVFVEAGGTLAAEALAGGVAALERRPEAAGAADAGRDGTVEAAIYRRAAFEELRGFEDRPGRSCDDELAGRAAAYDLLRDPGLLLGADGG